MAVQLLSTEDEQIRTTFAYVLLYALDYLMEIVFRLNLCCNTVYVVNRDKHCTSAHSMQWLQIYETFKASLTEVCICLS
jgi:hypothetical protein